MGAHLQAFVRRLCDGSLGDGVLLRGQWGGYLGCNSCHSALAYYKATPFLSQDTLFFLMLKWFAQEPTLWCNTACMYMLLLSPMTNFSPT